MSGRIVRQSLLSGLVLLALAVGAGLIYLQASGARMLSVQSGSMVPALHKGDLITVTRVPESQLAVGDVVTFVNPHNRAQTITHRVVQLPSANNNHKLITKGDANAVADQPISPDSVVGKVSLQVPLAGYAIDFVRKPLGLALIIYVPALIIVVQEFRRLVRHYQKMQPYRLYGRPERQRPPTGKERLATGAKMMALGVVIGASVIIPAHAALTSQAQLTDNRLATLPRAMDHIMLRRVAFQCALDNTAQLNKLPEIIMYNPTTQDINTGGWYIESSAGRIVTFRPQTVFDARADYDIEPDLPDGVRYEGDYLALFDNTGKLVDAISWGTDTTYLNPSLPGTQDGTVFRRFDLVFDTDTAVDWAVSVEECTAE